MSPSLVVLPGRTGRSVVHPFGGGGTTVATARASGRALVWAGRPAGTGALWTKEPMPAVDHSRRATQLLLTAPAGSRAGRGGQHRRGHSASPEQLDAKRPGPGRRHRGLGWLHIRSRSTVLRVSHPSVVVRGKRCQIGHFVAAFPARPNPGDNFRDPFEHVRPWPTGGAAEQSSHSVQGVAVGGHFPGLPAERLDDGLFVVLSVDADPARGVDGGHLPCLSDSRGG